MPFSRGSAASVTAKDSSLLVVKFGGSSLASAERIKLAAGSVAAKVSSGTKVVVVVSAMGKTTDELLLLAKEVTGSSKGFELDDILSMGERTSARIFAAALNARGVKAEYIDPADPSWPIITDGNFGNASPLLDETEKKVLETIPPMLEKGITPIVPGFLGKTRDGKITTLGRGGSDVTAMLLARALKCDVVLVSDVDGILSADPKLVENPRKIDRISVEKLIGLSSVGTKFIHQKALRVKPDYVDVKLVNFRKASLDASGTVIEGSFPELVAESLSSPLMSITIVGDNLADNPEVFLELTRVIRAYGAPILGMSANHDSIIAYLPIVSERGLLDKVHGIVVSRENALAMAVRPRLALIAVKGVGLEETPGMIARVTTPLQRAGINVYGIFTITSSIQLLVSWEDREEALRLIREELGLSSPGMGQNREEVV